MIAKLAQFGVVARGVALRPRNAVTVAFPARDARYIPRLPPRLACKWVMDPRTRTPSCVWTDVSALSVSDDPSEPFQQFFTTRQRAIPMRGTARLAA